MYKEEIAQNERCYQDLQMSKFDGVSNGAVNVAVTAFLLCVLQHMKGF